MNRPPQGRRASVRHEVVANQARMGWQEGSEIRSSETLLFDISCGGTLLITKTAPSLRQAVWMRIDKPLRTDAVRAAVTRHGGANHVGLSFSDPCPDNLRLVATLGINPFAILRWD